MKTAWVTRSMVVCAAFLFACPAVLAEQYPARPIRMVVPFAPGGISDLLARAVAEKITGPLGQTVIVDNRAGAGGNIGTRIVAKAAADAYTLIFCSPAFATNVSISADAGYDPVKDFAPVAQVASATNILVVAPQIGIRSLPQLIEASRKRPGEFNYGSGGAGTSGQLAAELFQSASDVRMTHVPYKGAGPALTALLGNEVQLMFLPVVLAIPHLTSGRLVPLAVTGAQRYRATPNVPTISEVSIPGFDVTSWFGILAPAATPQLRVTLLNLNINRVLRLPELAERMVAQGAEPEVKSPKEFGDYVQKEVERWSRVIKTAGIKNR